ncbi:hypothetical protein GCM10027055_11170 [Janibacter alkaliphilus]|uniref:DUF456 domain-containing protein n=1 Tax=Janibacter alkaliphilus TaxID=1069963 RepID=A0A852X4Q3_9MICO|nr:hypothetical protein [Janibacter alkaliphilus]
MSTVAPLLGGALPLSDAPDPVTWAMWLFALAFAIGVVGIVLPVLPGLLLCTATVLVWAIDTGGTRAWMTFGVAVLVYLCGVALQVLVPGRRMRRDGVATSTLLLAAVAGIVGFFVVPVVGLPLFFVGGIMLVELARYRELSKAWDATRAALRGVVHSMGIELLTAAAIGFVWVAGIASHMA